MRFTETLGSDTLATKIGTTTTMIETTTATEYATPRPTAHSTNKNALAVDLDHSIAPYHTRASKATAKLTSIGTKAAAKKKRTKSATLHVRTRYKNRYHRSHIASRTNRASSLQKRKKWNQTKPDNITQIKIK
jgi:hypothetical protein